MCWLQNVLGSPIVLGWTLPGVNTAGHTKRSTVIGVFFVFYCAGNIAGPHLFLAKEVPRYFTAIRGLVGTYCALIFFQAVYTVWCVLENKKREKSGVGGLAVGGPVENVEELFEGFDDLTDKENKHFRYRI
jgi:hypothetical protein